ncbi:MAG: flap endonuclease-1 [Candidatus Diapherotrites archaeon]|uniref:Flap endonuclease 1 n=1 Tax=Candidatus Iainarchaeum sp. TaxID=3101447 RepID=A0A8T3YHC0_9ARCH|nr:flap endonuclease-1 [Candidatus Diapherotrites archaeon]
MGTAIGDIVPRQGISLDSLNGRTLGFDSHNIIYQFLSSIRGEDGTPLKDSHGSVTSHLAGLFYRTINLAEKGVRPVFVFDGAPSALKGETLRRRRETRTEATHRHEEAVKAGDLEEARKWGSRALRLDEKMVSDAKQLLVLMGFPVVQAPGEGEAQVVAMAMAGRIDGCVSQDYDSLLFGAPVLYRNVGVSGKRKVPGRNIYADVEPEKIILEKVLSENGITRRKLIWLAMLVGTDFNEKFPGIGVKSALKLVKQNDSFDAIVAGAKSAPDFDWREVESLFMEPIVSQEYSIGFSAPQHDRLVDFLCGKHDFSNERVSRSLERLSAVFAEKSKQSTLGAWA